MSVECGWSACNSCKCAAKYCVCGPVIIINPRWRRSFWSEMLKKPYHKLSLGMSSHSSRAKFRASIQQRWGSRTTLVVRRLYETDWFWWMLVGSKGFPRNPRDPKVSQIMGQNLEFLKFWQQSMTQTTWFVDVTNGDQYNDIILVTTSTRLENSGRTSLVSLWN